MPAHTRLTVTHFYREPEKNGRSINGMLKTIKNDLEDRIPFREAYCLPGTSGIKNIRNAAAQTSAINHIADEAGFITLGLNGRKNIITIHDGGSFGRITNDIHKNFFQSFWWRLLLRNTSIITTISDTTKQNFSSIFSYPLQKITVIPPPIKPVFKYMYKDELANKPVILILGTAKHKNLHNLIDAVKDLNVHIDIVGEPAKEDIAKLNTYNLSHTTHQHLSDEQVFDRYMQCDMVFAAAHTEGFCLPLVEAQAVGRPVIASNFAGVNEIAGNAALLVDPSRPDHIRDAITTLIADRQRYGALVTQGLRNAARFHHKLISEQYFRLYLHLHKQ